MRRRDPLLLFEQATAGDRTSLARLLSVVEQGGPDAVTASEQVWAAGGRAYTVGITGAPGAGKSTLTDRLIGEVRGSGDEVAVLAIDPSSPYTGGAILGDRVRMSDHFLDSGVFIRSMATRGHLGGLALAAPAMVRVLDAAGFPWVLLETVGVGQVEVEIAGAADTTVVVVNPGWGDAVQANKAGLLEIADIFVINKADRKGVADTQRDLEGMLDLSSARADGWRPPILRTIAATGDGVAALWTAIGDHRLLGERTGRLAERRTYRLRAELRDLVVRGLQQRADALCRGAFFDALEGDLLARRVDPETAAARIVDRL